MVKGKGKLVSYVVGPVGVVSRSGWTRHAGQDRSSKESKESKESKP